MNLFKKKEKSLAEKNKELDEEYENLLLQTRVDNIKAGQDYQNLTLNKNFVLVTEAKKNEAEKKKAESQTQSKLVNGVQVVCTVVTTASAVAVWHKDQKEGNATRTEVGKAFAQYGRNILNFFKKNK